MEPREKEVGGQRAKMVVALSSVGVDANIVSIIVSFGVTGLNLVNDYLHSHIFAL